MTSVSYWQFFLASIFGLLPTQVLNTYMGSTVRSMQEVLTDRVDGYIILGVQVIFSIILMLYLLNKARRELAKLTHNVKRQGEPWCSFIVCVCSSENALYMRVCMYGASGVQHTCVSNLIVASDSLSPPTLSISAFYCCVFWLALNFNDKLASWSHLCLFLKWQCQETVLLCHPHLDHWYQDVAVCQEISLMLSLRTLKTIHDYSCLGKYYPWIWNGTPPYPLPSSHFMGRYGAFLVTVFTCRVNTLWGLFW